MAPRRTRRRIVAMLATACTIAGLAMAACESDSASDAAYEEYFRMLGPEMEAFEGRIGTLVASQEGLDVAALSAILSVYADELDAQADALGELDVPGEAAEPHRQFIVAFRLLAEAKALQSEQVLGGDSGLTDEELGERVDERSSDWFEACHKLQDLALVHEIEVDLKCVTALHRKT